MKNLFYFLILTIFFGCVPKQVLQPTYVQQKEIDILQQVMFAQKNIQSDIMRDSIARIMAKTEKYYIDTIESCFTRGVLDTCNLDVQVDFFMFLDNNDIRIWVNDYLSSKISKDDLNQLIKFKIKEGFDLLTKGQKWYNNFKNQ